MSGVWVWMCLCAHIVHTHALFECPAAADDGACRADGVDDDGNKFIVDGKSVYISSHENGKSFRLYCEDETALDSESLPRSSSELRVSGVFVRGCVLPGGGRSVRAALAALNVTLLPGEPLRLKLGLQAPTPLSAAHLAGMRRLAALKLMTWLDTSWPAVAADFLTALPGLRELTVWYARLVPGALEHAPATLVNLTLYEAGVEVPDSVFSLPELRLLSVTSWMNVVPRPGAVGRAPGLRSVTLDVPVSVDLDEVLSPTVESLSLSGWSCAAPRPVTRCGALHTLKLRAPAGRLPRRWLAACPRLRRLALEEGRLRRLPPKLLARTSALTDLELSFVWLGRTPPDLLHYSPKLRYLSLAGNFLRTLPTGTFAASGALRVLDLAYNRLEGNVLDELAGLRALEELDLSDWHAGDFCYSNSGSSRLRHLRNLEKLSLGRSHITTICKDWRADMPRLRTLNLKNTLISHLGCEDLEFNRTIDSTVTLSGSPVTAVTLNVKDYYATTESDGSDPLVTIQLDENEPLACDCGMYWTWRATQSEPARLSRSAAVTPLLCGPAPSRPLHRLAEDELTCPLACAPCACRQRPAGAPAAPRRHLSVRCESVHALPRIWNDEDSVDLTLTHANITRLLLDDIPANFRLLDLRNNNIEGFEPEVVAALVADGPDRRVYISNNPLKCSCDAAGWLARLRERAIASYPSLPDYAEATCADGRLLADVARTITPCK